MKILPTGVPAPRPDRPATQLLHDEPNTRVVCFHLAPGQQVPPHTSGSTVVVQVLDGHGIFRGETEEARLGPGETAIYRPDEVHSMQPDGDGPLRFLAIITPRP